MELQGYRTEDSLREGNHGQTRQASVDYKFMCFDGKPKLLFMGIGIAAEDGDHASDGYCDVFDMDFHWLPVTDERAHYTEEPIQKPDNWDEMIAYAGTLAKPFRHCRVDLYNVGGKYILGKLRSIMAAAATI